MLVSNIITRKDLNRRALLKGSGVTLALPYLNVMGGSQANENRNRFVAICACLGFHRENLVPLESGQDYKHTKYTELIKNHKKKFTVLSGISHPNQQGANGHSSEMTWLTSAQRPGLAGFKNSISIDQVIAHQVGSKTRYPYFALSTSSNSSMSWTSTGVEIPGEGSPEKLFKAMFVNGTEKQIEAEIQNLKRGRSILDKVLARAKSMHQNLGHEDQHKMEEYFEAIRSLETSLLQTEAWAKRPKPNAPVKPIKDEKDRAKAIVHQDLMYQIMHLALVSDATRTMTFRIAAMSSVPDIEGVKTDWHNLSHHGKDPKKIKELSIIEAAEFKAFNRFLNKLEASKEGGETLLDKTSILFGSNLGNASAHQWKNLSLIFAGGKYKHQGHIAGDSKNNTPLANLFVSIANRSGVRIDKFGSSTANGIKDLDFTV